jgi:hypothetical protein
VPDPDPCAITGTVNVTKLAAYDKCRFDRIEAAIPGNQTVTVTPPPVTVTAPPVTVTVTTEPTATPTTTEPAPTTTAEPTTAPTTTAPTTTEPPPPGDWPGPDNTGVPAGVTLAPYTGPMTITTATTIDAKTINGRFVVEAPLTITRSKITGSFDVDYAGGTLNLSDSEVNGGTDSAPAVGYGDITMKRVEVIGSRVSVLCGSNCDIQDSWLHAQYLKPGSDWHVNGYVSNGGSNVLVKHNTIACDTPDNSNGGGCTGPGASFGDFAPLKNITYENNLFKAGPGGFCLAAGHNPSKPYGSNPTNVKVLNNVFERGPGGKCGYWGAITSFLNANGNVASGNTWDDGGPVNP